MLGQHRSTQRRIPRGREDEDRLVADMMDLAAAVAVTTIDGSPPYCATLACGSTTSGSSACGGARG